MGKAKFMHSLVIWYLIFSDCWYCLSAVPGIGSPVDLNNFAKMWFHSSKAKKVAWNAGIRLPKAMPWTFCVCSSMRGGDCCVLLLVKGRSDLLIPVQARLCLEEVTFQQVRMVAAHFDSYLYIYNYMFCFLILWLDYIYIYNYTINYLLYCWLVVCCIVILYVYIYTYIYIYIYHAYNLMVIWYTV